MENKSHAYAAGAFVLVVGALLIAMAAWLMPDAIEQRVYELTTREAVNGLRPQAMVRFRGVAVGRVSDISFDPAMPGNVLIRLSVDQQAPITTSTYATLTLQGVTGAAFVQLDDGGGGGQALATNKKTPARIPLRPSLMSRLGEQGGDILNQLAESSRRINLMLGPQNQQVMLNAVQNIGQAAAGVQQLTATVDSLVRRQLDPTQVDVARLSREATVTLQSLQQAARNAGEGVEDMRKTAQGLTRLADQLSAPGGTLERLGDSVSTLNAVGQTVNAGTLPRLHRASDEASRTARQVGRLAETLKEQPQVLLFGTVPAAPGPGEPGFAAPSRRP